MLSELPARELLQWQRLWAESPWGPLADDWRTGFIMAAMNGQTPDANRPKWGQSAAEPKFVELTFEQACNAFGGKPKGNK